ncbi:MAG TPA: hypothetical protein VGX25_15315 [Actinophytocola sp.]|uniref:hypothetical protein n=1 Tax=Actinophytocola sp. TaxID=1872138 RepID=UPI002DDD4F41|nr:hypothetical protein [Actinophytocola sp.]HEV2780758.1 hypothetical protein [Actinophytocola sp.]
MSSGLAATLGAGLLAGLAPAASAAGTWLLVALVLAAFLAVGCGLSTSENQGFLGVLGRIAGAAAIAGTFGAYLLPADPLPAAIGLIAVAAAVTALGFRPPPAPAVAVVLAVLAAFVAACLAIDPAGQAVPPPPGVPGADDLAGLPAATALMFFGFLGFERAASRRAVVVTIAVALAVHLAVAAAALRQLGGPRLALSAAPLRDALAAADASGLRPPLTVAATIAAMYALLGVLAGLPPNPRPVILPVAAVLAAACAALLTVPTLIAAAAGLMLAHYAVGAVLSRRRARGPAPPR